MKEELQLLSVFMVHLASPFPNMRILAYCCRGEKKSCFSLKHFLDNVQNPLLADSEGFLLPPPPGCIQKTLSYQFKKHTARNSFR